MKICRYLSSENRRFSFALFRSTNKNNSMRITTVDYALYDRKKCQ